jgi:hypothetical protein
MQHYNNWMALPELIRTTAIYRSYLGVKLKNSDDMIRDLRRYELISNMLFAYNINEHMPAFYDGLDPVELEVILQMHGVDVDLV